MKEERCIRRYITTTSGMRGSFAVLMGVFSDGKGEWAEPILTSPFSGTSKEARKDADDWAKAEGLEVV
ncbi:MAG: hypothetical protein WC554_04300 [Clostridia bacterium]